MTTRFTTSTPQRFVPTLVIAPLLLLILQACGSAVPAGTYQVTERITRDTCGLDQRNFDVTYEITENDGSYTVMVTDDQSSEALVFRGRERLGEAVVTVSDSYSVQGCRITMNGEMRLRAKRSSLEGEGTGDFHACDGSSCEIAWDIVAR